MSKYLRIISYGLALILCMTSFFSIADFRIYAAVADDLLLESIFLKQQEANTCTLASSAIMMRRTAICAGYAEWEDITEDAIKDAAWVDGVGLRWSFTSFGMTIGHSYFSTTDKKQELLDLLELYPQGLVVYNGGTAQQYHAVFLCDYDEDTDTFYAADPSSTAELGRLAFTDTTILGDTQDEQINNLTAYWFVDYPAVTLADGVYSADELTVGDSYNPNSDIETYNDTKTEINSYYVVTDTSVTGTALRYYPSGSAAAASYVKKDTILFIEYEGSNNFGAQWYKTNDGYYVFSSNLIALNEYSTDIIKFSLTAVDSSGTYTVKTDSENGAALRIEPVEGNNITAYVEDGTQLYITETGYNSVGSCWLKTENGYYLKATEAEFFSDSKPSDYNFDTEITTVSGLYSTKPIEDVYYFGDYSLYSVTASALNVRKTAIDGEILGLLKKGDTVEILEIVDGWGKIDYSGSEAWLSMDYLEFVADSETTSGLDGVYVSTKKALKGSSVTCSVQSDKEYTYKYFVYDYSGTAIYSSDSYVQDTEFEYTPESSGRYYFCVFMCDSDNNITVVYSADFVIYTQLQIDSVKLTSGSDKFYVNSTIEWTVVVSAVATDTVYVYKLYRNGELLEQIESDVAKYSYTPLQSGTYSLVVCLKDNYSSSDAVTAEDVYVADELVVSSIETTSNVIKPGESVTFTVSATGGSGSYFYAFNIYFKNGDIFEKYSYTTMNTKAVVFDEYGVYSVYCYVLDSDNNVAYSIKKIVVSEYDYGDVDGDGSISSKDARLVLRHSASLEALPEKGEIAADVTADEKVTSADARLILRYAAKLEKSFF